MPTYELTFVLDPRLSDEETQALCDEYKQMIEAAGGRVEHRDDWGKRQLAYAIGKLEEGRYFLWHLSSDNGNPTREVERRMRQKEEVLRFLTVRTEKLDFDAADAEEATETGKEPVREEAPAKEAVEEPAKETPAAAATPVVSETSAEDTAEPAAPETPVPAEPAAPETPVPAEPPAPQTAPATEDETAPAAPSEADSGAVEAAEAEEEAAVDEAPNAGDAASGDDETPSEEETR